jgi:ribosome-binding factor A
MARRRQSSSRRYPRTARLNELVREIVAEELERIDDERLGFLTITAVEVDPGIEHAKIHWSNLEASDEVVLEVLEEHRPRLQQAVNRQTHMRRTPILSFHADEVARGANRIEEILRELDIPEDEATTDDATDDATDAAPETDTAPADDDA